jgi:hypothetical protein
MFYTSFIKPFAGAVNPPRALRFVSWALPLHVRDGLAVRVTACATRAHFLAAPSPGRMTTVPASGLPQAGSARTFPVTHLRRAGKMAARAALRMAYAGNPLTPGGYAILALAVIAVALVAMASASSISNEPEPALRLIGL